MSVSSDILESYRHPRAVMRRKLANGLREDRALATLMAACGLNFVSQWPGLARAAYLDPSKPLEARLGAALLASVFLVPLIAYAIGTVTHLIARALGGRGTAFGARLALFWAMLVITPLLLLNGLVAGFIGDGPQKLVVGVAVLMVFLVIWGNCLIEAQRSQ